MSDIVVDAKSLHTALVTTDSVVHNFAEELARKRARITYTLEIEQFDIKKKEQRLDGETLYLYFVFPLHTAGVQTQTLAQSPFLAKHFKMRMEHAFSMRCSIEVEMGAKLLYGTTITRVTGKLAEWDAKTFYIHNMDSNTAGELPWKVDVTCSKDGVLETVTFAHNPDHFKTLHAYMHGQAVAIEEERILRMAHLVPKEATKKRRAEYMVGGLFE